MNRKKLFRNIGIIAFIVLLFVGLSFFGGNNSVDYQSVNTSTILQQIKDDNVEKAVVEDREQVLKVILKKKTKVELDFILSLDKILLGYSFLVLITI